MASVDIILFSSFHVIYSTAVRAYHIKYHTANAFKNFIFVDVRPNIIYIHHYMADRESTQTFLALFQVCLRCSDVFNFG